MSEVLGGSDGALEQGYHDESTNAELEGLGRSRLPDREQQSDDEPDEEHRGERMHPRGRREGEGKPSRGQLALR